MPSCSSAASSQSASLMKAVDSNNVIQTESGEHGDCFNKFTFFLDEHLQLFRAGVALIGLTGIVLIGRSVRVMKSFHSVSDIPEEFIRKHMTLRGKVVGHEQNHLRIKHLPIINRMEVIKKRPKDSSLPVHIAGVDISESNAHHLAEIAPLETLLWFRMLAVNKEEGLDCIVSMRKHWYSSIMVNEQLVLQGFAKVQPLESSPVEPAVAVKLMQRLIKAELYAEKKSKGLWARPSLSERMKERVVSMQVRMKGIVNSVTKPISAGTYAIQSLGAKIGKMFRSKSSG